jgi:rhomboid protease GluP
MEGGASGGYMDAPQAIPERPAKHRSIAGILLAINVVVYVAMVLKGISPLEPTPRQLLQWGADFGPAVAAGQSWRLVTSAFVHAGIIHLAMNMYCLWYLAELAENIFGAGTTFLLYVLTAISSSLLSLIWHPQIVSVGASGAIFGFAGAVITGLRVGRHRIPQPVRRALSGSALRFALINLVIASFLPFVDNAGHVGGLIGGLCLGTAWAAFGSMRTQQDVPFLRAGIGLAFLALMMIALRALFHGNATRWI